MKKSVRPFWVLFFISLTSFAYFSQKYFDIGEKKIVSPNILLLIQAIAVLKTTWVTDLNLKGGIRVKDGTWANFAYLANGIDN